MLDNYCFINSKRVHPLEEVDWYYGQFSYCDFIGTIIYFFIYLLSIHYNDNMLK